MIGKHRCTKPVNCSTFDPYWSGRSYAKHCRMGCTCPQCGERLHAEEGEHYCPRCDDYVRPVGQYHEAKGQDMTLRELLNSLDGCGIILEDEDLVDEIVLGWDPDVWTDGIDTELEVI